LAEKGGVPVGVIVGEAEIAENKVKIKKFGTKGDGDMVERASMVEEVKNLLKELHEL
jgi:histidyl-tRNA synthetase